MDFSTDQNNGGDGGDNQNCKDMLNSSQITTANLPTPVCLQARYSSCHPTNSVKTIKGILQSNRETASDTNT